MLVREIKRRRIFGFTLGEVMLAVLYISIAFFAYAALHQRIIFSSKRTMARATPREEARSQVYTAANSVYKGVVQTNLVPVKGVNLGLYKLDGKSEKFLYSNKQSQVFYKKDSNVPSYCFDTIVTSKRADTW